MWSCLKIPKAAAHHLSEKSSRRWHSWTECGAHFHRISKKGLAKYQVISNDKATLKANDLVPDLPVSAYQSKIDSDAANWI